LTLYGLAKIYDTGNNRIFIRNFKPSYFSVADIYVFNICKPIGGKGVQTVKAGGLTRIIDKMLICKMFINSEEYVT
jgi:hypothetical protein